MNNFTKDELDNIRLGIQELIANGSFDSEWNKDIKTLHIKIQSLIDNYCDHDETIEIEAPSDLCKKCNKVLSKDWI